VSLKFFPCSLRSANPSLITYAPFADLLRIAKYS
jgi:hypothetical protein